ncbi:response regulator [Paenibacillus alginolyticus]|uniref:Response regulator n=1 Tax=Paenibacillus alginolyticus TaxID=59839 RepID=A0ABT4GER4_9BACL|nr:response regulator [Paenibacillus alginolyticus]MCY9666626.1 response regulator [Paenibacillus alginolyticus]MCY9694680.1 response regulator [Paenibacillus alginolyticus]MEC0148020.1 response regulator [Paenibacillus alginolyticus]
MADKSIKVLIVDDELIVRKGLRATIPWERFDMEVVADAANGLKGWEAFVAYKPDVVITDIVMPKLNGLELALKVKEVAPETSVLLLSCHEDFAYAKQGLKLGASGYVLKTDMDEEEMESYLRQFQELFHKRQRQQGEQSEDAALDAKDQIAYIGAWLGGFYSAEEMEKQLRKWLDGDWAWMKTGCVVYGVVGELERMQDNEWEPAPGQRHIRIPCGSEKQLFVCKEDTHGALELKWKEAKSRIGSLSWTRSGPVTDSHSWMKAVSETYADMQSNSLYDQAAGSWPEPIAKAVQLLTSGESVTWSVAELAYRVGLSRSHFSTLFKKSVGENFIDFQAKYKLQKADELLLNTGLTVNDISDQLGMIDANYFSKWFKRCTGMTPSQYRANKKTNLTGQKGT